LTQHQHVNTIKNRVDYHDPFIKDDTMITLVEDYNQDFKPQNITYAEIGSMVTGEETTHQKIGGWE
jgi:hypothetical protein